MIVVEVCGGLGNQLFQYAFAMYMQNEYGYHIKYDRHWYKAERKSHEVFLLDQVDKLLQYHNFEGMSSCLMRSKVIRKLSIPVHLTGSMRIIKESELSNKTKPADNSYYIGFWQESIYASHIISLLNDYALRSVDFRNNISGVDENSVAVHVRRGDYLTNKDFGFYSHKHLVQSSKYYKENIIRAIELNPKANFHVFSDDIDWCKTNLFDVIPGDTHYWDSKELDTMRSFCVLFRFCAFIISSSTFSWWPAYANRKRCWFIASPDNFKLSSSLFS